MTNQTQNTEAALIEMPKINLPARTEVKARFHEGFGTVYTKIEKEIAETPVDMSTQKGRDLIRSLAYKISQTKTGLDKFGKGSTEELKAIVDAVNEERREMTATLDKMRDEVRAPLTAWENKEKEREAFVIEEFDYLRNIAAKSYGGVRYLDMTAEKLDELAVFVHEKSPCDKEVFIEAAENFNVLVVETYTTIRGRASRLRSEELERQELAALRARQEREEAERVEREAAEAEIARKEAEAQAMAVEAARVARREAQERIDAETRRAAEAEARAEEAERERKAVEDRAEVEREAAIKQAELDRVAAEERQKETEAKAAEDAERAKRKAEEEKQQAIEDERRKSRAAELAQKAAEDARAADLEHRGKINRGIVAAMMKTSEINEAQAKLIVASIANFKIPNVKVEY